MEKDLKKRVTDWLEKQGYPLEMRVASALRDVGFAVSQGEYYDDPDTKTSREIDVIAVKTDEYDILETSIVVECKRSADKPWVLFTSETHESGRDITLTYAVMSLSAREKLVKLSKKGFDKSMQDLLWLNKSKKTAYGMAVAFTKREDPAYKAALSALKASISQNISSSYTNVTKSLRFIFPVIVIDGNLFEAYLDKKGNTVVREIDEGTVTYYREISKCPVSSVRIVTTKRLERYCDEAFEEALQLEILLRDEIKKMWQQLKDSEDGIRHINIPKKG